MLPVKSEVVRRSCPACNSSKATKLGPKNNFDILSCAECGTLYTETLPGVSASEDYDAYYGVENLSVPEFINHRLDEIVDSFSRYRKTNRLLDVGCGAGSLLQAAAKAGWNAEGVEISRPAAEHVRAIGFRAFCGHISEAAYPSGHFDVVTASELLEHVSEPGPLVSEIARILRPGGLCWATTPHSKGASGYLLKLSWSVISPPEHLHLFSASGLKRLLLSQGFRRVNIQTEGVNPIEVLHRFRHDRRSAGDDNPDADKFNRVGTSYQLNEALVRSAPRRAVKNLANSILRTTRLGDSLKIRAER